MCNQTEYFTLARAEERAGHDACSSFTCLPSAQNLTAARQAILIETAKIRKLQLRLGIPDYQVFDLIHSYGTLTDIQCKCLLYFSIHGCLSGIYSVLENSPVRNGAKMNQLNGNEEFTLSGKNSGITVNEFWAGRILICSIIHTVECWQSSLLKNLCLKMPPHANAS